VFTAQFKIIENRTQDVIFGVDLFERTAAVIDYKRKQLILHDGVLCILLSTGMDFAKAVCTMIDTRIPPQYQAIVPVR